MGGCEAAQFDQLQRFAANEPTPKLDKTHLPVQSERRQVLGTRLNGEFPAVVSRKNRRHKTPADASALELRGDDQRRDIDTHAFVIWPDANGSNDLVPDERCEKLFSAGS
jgi:hypothetical protein